MRSLHLAAPLAVCALAAAACGSDSSTSSSSGAAQASSSSSSSSSAYTCAKGTLTASGSTALLPLVQKAATAYEAKCPGATITASGGGSSTGLSNVASGASDIGDSDVPVSFAKGVDKSAVTDHQVAVVLFEVLVNPKAGVSSLTTQQVQDVFSGKVTSWKQVGGADVPITLIERKPGSGTRLTFDKTVMKDVAESATPSTVQDSTQLVVQGVTQADGGVSYAASGNAGTLTAVSIDGAKATVDDVNSGKYPFFSHEHMYTKSTPSPLATDFINFMTSADFSATVTALKFQPSAKITKQSAVDKA